MINTSIIGEIDDLTEVYAQITDAAQEVEILINSPGGNAFEAIQLVNAIHNSSQPVTAKVEVQAMSAAAVIALGCDKVKIDRSAIVMLHNCWTIAIGNAKDLQQEVDACKAVDFALQDIITTHCSEENAEYIKARMDDGELWLTGVQVVELFDNVELVEKPQKEGLKAAAGSLADLIDKYNALVKAEKEEDPPAEDEPPDEPDAEEEKESEPEKKAYVVPDNIKAILDEVL